MNSKNVMAFRYGPCMTNNGKHNKLCQNFKFYQSEIDEAFEQTWHGPDGHQDIPHTFVEVHHIHQYEKQPNVDIGNCSL